MTLTLDPAWLPATTELARSAVLLAALATVMMLRRRKPWLVPPAAAGLLVIVHLAGLPLIRDALSATVRDAPTGKAPTSVDAKKPAPKK